MPEELVAAAWTLALLLGLLLDRRRSKYWIPMAILLRATYFGALRPGEAYALTCRGIALPSDKIRRFKGCGVLRIERPKNQQ